MVTSAGTLTTVVPLNTTFSPPDGAAALNVTVQAEFPGVTTEAGVQARVWTVVAGGCQPDTLIVPPLPETTARFPSPKAPNGVVTATGTEPVLVLAARVAVATATTPLVIGVEFIPVARHFTLPLPFWQTMLLPTAVRADPAETLTDVTSAGAKEKVHSSADGVPLVVIDRFSGTDPPWAEEPEARLKVV